MTRPRSAVGLALLLAAFLIRPARAEERYVVAWTRADRAALLSSDEGAWRDVSRLVWGPAAYETAFRAVWNEDGLIIRFDAKDADPWHTLVRRDDPLWEEEVVEVFLDLDRSGRDYAEVEISPANVICDVRMVEPWPNKRMDLSWNLEGIESRVHLRRDRSARTTGWTATAFLPWNGFRSLPSARRVALPPRPGDRWRFNLFRIERPFGKHAPESERVEVAWSPSKDPSFHVPSVFRDLVFGRR